MPRVHFSSLCIAFGVGVVLMLEANRYIFQTNLCTSPAIESSTTKTMTLNITKLLMELTRTMVQNEMKDYNYTYSGVEKLENLLIEHEGTPVRSLIISSWRSGSSFLGDLLNAVPSNFYNYEPLIQYGSSQIRGPPYMSNCTKVIKDMLKCNFRGVESFYFDYIKQIRKTVNQIQINKRLWSKCSYDEEALCYNSDFVSKLCKLFPFQSMKTVRYRLPVAESILADRELNAKIVFLVRDPRAVLHSRKNFCSGSCARAKTVCSDMVRDYSAAVRFSEKYPEKLTVIRFEDLILKLDESTSRLLIFLQRERTPSVDQFLKLHTNINNSKPFSTFRVSQHIPFKWRKQMKFNEVDRIQGVCQLAMSKWGYVKALSSVHMLSSDFYPLRSYTLKNIKWKTAKTKKVSPLKK